MFPQEHNLTSSLCRLHRGTVLFDILGVFVVLRCTGKCSQEQGSHVVMEEPVVQVKLVFVGCMPSKRKVYSQGV